MLPMEHAATPLAPTERGTSDSRRQPSAERPREGRHFRTGFAPIRYDIIFTVQSPKDRLSTLVVFQASPERKERQRLLVES